MCKTPKIPQADASVTRPAAPVEAARALASPFAGLIAPGMNQLRVGGGGRAQPGTGQATTTAPYTGLTIRPPREGTGR